MIFNVHLKRYLLLAAFLYKNIFPRCYNISIYFRVKNLQALLVVVMQFIKGRYVENVIISYVLTEQNIMKTCNLSTFTATIFSQSHPESQQLCALYVRGSPGQESIYGGFFCFVIFWFLFFFGFCLSCLSLNCSIMCHLWSLKYISYTYN